MCFQYEQAGGRCNIIHRETLKSDKEDPSRVDTNVDSEAGSGVHFFNIRYLAC